MDDARFIAAANPETVLALIARIRELAVRLKDSTEDLKNMRVVLCHHLGIDDPEPMQEATE